MYKGRIRTRELYSKLTKEKKQSGKIGIRELHKKGIFWAILLVENEKRFVVYMLFGNLVLPDWNNEGCNWKGGFKAHMRLIDCF